MKQSLKNKRTKKQKSRKKTFSELFLFFLTFNKHQTQNLFVFFYPFSVFEKSNKTAIPHRYIFSIGIKIENLQINILANYWVTV